MTSTDRLVTGGGIETGAGANSASNGDGTAARRVIPSVKYKTIHGYRRAYRMMGSGPPLLLLHGIGDSSASWVPIMPALAEHHTVIAPDFLGHGNSDKPRADYSAAAFANGMRDLLEVLDIDRATVVGHSLGGGIAAQVAYQYPERCERLVLVSSGGVERDVNPLLRLCAAPFSDLLLTPLRLPLGRLGIHLALDALTATGHPIGRDADELRRVFESLPDGPARGAFTRTLRSVVDWRGQVVTMLDRCYLAAHMPVLIMWGTHDAVIPVEHATVAHEAMAGSRLEIFDGAGHFPHHFDPERFQSLLADFIATTEPATYDRETVRDLLRSGPPVQAPGLI